MSEEEEGEEGCNHKQIPLILSYPIGRTNNWAYCAVDGACVVRHCEMEWNCDSCLKEVYWLLVGSKYLRVTA